MVRADSVPSVVVAHLSSPTFRAAELQAAASRHGDDATSRLKTPTLPRVGSAADLGASASPLRAPRQLQRGAAVLAALAASALETAPARPQSPLKLPQSSHWLDADARLGDSLDALLPIGSTQRILATDKPSLSITLSPSHNKSRHASPSRTNVIAPRVERVQLASLQREATQRALKHKPGTTTSSPHQQPSPSKRSPDHSKHIALTLCLHMDMMFVFFAGSPARARSPARRDVTHVFTTVTTVTTPCACAQTHDCCIRHDNV